MAILVSPKEEFVDLSELMEGDGEDIISLGFVDTSDVEEAPVRMMDELVAASIFKVRP